MNYITEQMNKAGKLCKKADYAIWLDGGPKKGGPPDTLKAVFHVPEGADTRLCIYLEVAIRNKTERLLDWHCKLVDVTGIDPANDRSYCIGRLDRPDLDLQVLMQWARMAAAMHASSGAST